MRIGNLVIEWQTKQSCFQPEVRDVYRFCVQGSENIVIGEPSTFRISATTDLRIKPQRLTSNALCGGMVYFRDIKCCNVSCLLGDGEEDAFNYEAHSVGQSMDFPEMLPANSTLFTCRYTGLIPSGYTKGDIFTFSVSLKGPARFI